MELALELPLPLTDAVPLALGEVDAEAEPDTLPVGETLPEAVPLADADGNDE